MLDRFYIVRAGWMIGGGPQDKKFVGKLMQIMQGGETHLRAVSDKVGTPTYAKDLATGILSLIDTGYYGLYHMVNSGGACSRYDVAVALRELIGRDDVTVEPVSSAYFPLPAPRARSEAMVNYKLDPILASVAALLIGGLIGAWQGFCVAYMRIPSFIVTLSGMLLFRGLTLFMLQGQPVGPFPESFRAIASGGRAPVSSPRRTAAR